MFRRLDDFRKAWTEEAKHTVAVLEAIPDPALGTAITPGHRDLRRLAWHLVESAIEMPTRMGLAVTGAELVKGGFIGPPPSGMRDIIQTYSAASDDLLKGIENWSDADLERDDEMYGEIWKRGHGLMVLLVHQTHHRGQMTVLMRQAGLLVPSIYGPVKEGWSSYGVEPPKV
jgi:uncharacterized damage-inducible protein DinB